ncbi:hypothetical protein [Duganella sp. BuS-21]|uniref:hypothetical protein n=1 Tax=Duganella sp. BuS-21 TaxID=2943848 RepID=UPI0035A5C052
MTARKIVLMLVVCALATGVLACCLYAAGYVYFLLNKATPSHIELGTWWMYWKAYGDHPQQRIRLLVSVAIPLIAVIAAVLLALRPTPRSLHGDARWATRRDIDDAGLL